MVNGEWKMENGKWEMGNGKWEWEMAEESNFSYYPISY